MGKQSLYWKLGQLYFEIDAMFNQPFKYYRFICVMEKQKLSKTYLNPKVELTQQIYNQILVEVEDAIYNNVKDEELVDKLIQLVYRYKMFEIKNI